MEAFACLMKAEFGWESTNCVAHRIQLCVEDGLKIDPIALLLAICQKLVGHFKHSTVATGLQAKKEWTCQSKGLY